MSDEPTIRAEPPADGGAAHPPYPEDVEVLELGGRRIVLVGTAHISQESVDLVRLVIERERPAVVCVELDQRLLLNLMLASYQKRLGGKLGIVPGSELLAAIELAKTLGIPFELCDRDVRITLRRAWASLSLGRKAMLLSGVISSVGQTADISEEDIRKLRRKDALSEVMEEFGRALPELKRALIDERDSYLATKIQSSPGATIVAVVGAGHVAGMARALTEGRSADLADLETIPKVSSTWVMASWAVTLSVVAAIVYIGATEGVKAASSNALIWCLAHSIPSALGGILALAHPLTVLSAFVSAPFTALSPLIGVGHVTAFVQAYLVPPRVTEFQSVGDEMAQPLAWWRNRLLRVFLVFILTSLGGVLGTWVAGAKILSNLLR
jgi:pheromone shutdown-related protein TraB